MRHEKCIKLSQFRCIRRSEEPSVPIRLQIHSGTVEEHQTRYPIRVLGSYTLHYPAAHRPAAQIDLFETKSVKKADYDRSFVRYRIGEIRRLFTLAVSGQIRQIDPVP